MSQPAGHISDQLNDAIRHFAEVLVKGWAARQWSIEELSRDLSSERQAIRQGSEQIATTLRQEVERSSSGWLTTTPVFKLLIAIPADPFGIYFALQWNRSLLKNAKTVPFLLCHWGIIRLSPVFLDSRMY
ncbi:MAG TPA: hypothetical protein VFZ58_01455 [Candidatus Saccharimonadales bacterium]